MHTFKETAEESRIRFPSPHHPSGSVPPPPEQKRYDDNTGQPMVGACDPRMAATGPFNQAAFLSVEDLITRHLAAVSGRNHHLIVFLNMLPRTMTPDQEAAVRFILVQAGVQD